MEIYTVYVKANDSGYITAVNSSEFLKDATGWIRIDEGSGDKYHHAQGNYFAKSVTTEAGAFRYRLVNGVPQECSAEDIAAQEAASDPEQEKSADNGNVWHELDAAYQEGVDSV